MDRSTGSRISHVAAGLLVTTLAGCAPNLVDYVHPSMPGGTEVVGDCIPAPYRTEFPAGDLQLRVSSVRAHDGRTFVILQLIPKRDMSFAYAEGPFRFHAADRGTTIHPDRVSVRRSDGEADTTTPYRFDHRQIGPLQFEFRIEFELPPDVQRRYALEMPDLVVDGVTHAIPDITFERRTWAGISPFNC